MMQNNIEIINNGVNGTGTDSSESPLLGRWGVKYMREEGQAPTCHYPVTDQETNTQCKWWKWSKLEYEIALLEKISNYWRSELPVIPLMIGALGSIPFTFKEYADQLGVK